MKFNKNSILLILTICFLGCDNNVKELNPEEINSKPVLKETTTNSSISNQDNKVIPTKEVEPDTSTTITFTDITIFIPRLILFDPSPVSQTIKTDSIYLVPEIGETVLGQLITINSQNLENLKIEQRFETSVSIAAEGPHCDLLDWKHYYSDWKELKKRSNNVFISEIYSENETKKFPEITIEELKQKVKQHCGEDWYQLVKSIKSPIEDPSWVGLSRIFLRVSGKDKSSGKIITKIIVLEEAMGC